MVDKSYVLFSLKLYDFYKSSPSNCKISKNFSFDCSGEISPNLYIDRLLLLKVYKVPAKKSMEGIRFSK